MARFSRRLAGFGTAAMRAGHNLSASAFTVDRRVRHLVRLAFCKDQATLDEAVRRLRRLKPL